MVLPPVWVQVRSGLLQARAGRSYTSSLARNTDSGERREQPFDPLVAQRVRIGIAQVVDEADG